MKVVGYILAGIIGVAALVGLAFVLELGGLQWKSYFGPKHEEVRREVFKETRSYNEAKTQDLAKYRLEYVQADTDEEKKVIASTIKHMFADYDAELLPGELKTFLVEIRGY